jgi:hypothetical protein
MKDSKGAHVYWTRPRAGTLLTALERSVLAASAVVWRSVNGPIVLFTDRLGRDELGRFGLLTLWDQVDTETLESIPEDINASAFWDLGKTVVLARIPPGIFLLDLDLIVWDPLQADKSAVMFLHWESPVPPWYPGPGGLSTAPGYAFDPNFDWEAPVCNTALLCSPKEEVSEAFVASALRFAQGNRPDGTGIAEMLFAGQRLLAHTARRLKVALAPVLDYLYVPCGESRWLGKRLEVEDPLTPDACLSGVAFTHLWRFKHIFREQPGAAADFQACLVQRCRDRAAGTVTPWESVISFSEGPRERIYP